MLSQSLVNTELLNLRTLFQSHGFDLRFVGGCVRDSLAGQQPKDVDLCTDANPFQQAVIYKQYNVRHIPTGIAHGTYTVVLADKLYEITSLRRDVSTNGRRATVAYTTDWVEDLARRDFTINAMQLTFDGKLVDPFGGKDDLLNGIVRFVGDPMTRINEDHLRVLRWYRFVGRFNKNKKTPAVELPFDKVSKLVGQLSKERVWQELQLILLLDNWDEIIRCMLHHGVLKHVIKHKSIFWLNADAATVTELTRDPITRLMALFEPKFVVDLLHDLKASNADINKANLLENWYQSKAKPRELLVLGHSRYLVKEFCILKEYDEFELAVIESWDPPVFPISGGDILACGVPQGPKIGEWLRYLYKQWCDTNYALSRDELLNRIK